MKEIKQPTPPKKPTSKGLLSPHNSILDTLNNNGNEINSGVSDSNIDPVQKNFAPSEKENFNVSSWLDVNNNDYSNLYPIPSRPTSSVLSSSPDLDTVRNHHGGNYTFENSPLHNQVDLSRENQEHTAETFILPDFSNYPKKAQEQQIMNMNNNINVTFDDDKILILGSKKFQVYESLSLPIQNSFTLHTSLKTSIILVIFDGLNKIGNILNQLKFLFQQQAQRSNSCHPDGGLVIIPFYRNIDFNVILNLLGSYKLLCHPISYNNKREINLILSSLLTNTGLEYHQLDNEEPRGYINLSEEDDHTIELPLNQNDVLQINSFHNMARDHTKDNEERRITSNKSILIKHQITKSLSTVNNNNLNDNGNNATPPLPPLNSHIPKKRRSSKNSTIWGSIYRIFTRKLFTWKFWESKRFLLVPLTIGLGLGILLALSLPYINTATASKKAQEEIIINAKRMKRELMRNKMISLNDKLQKLVRFFIRKTNHVIDQWDEQILNSTEGYGNTILWGMEGI